MEAEVAERFREFKQNMSEQCSSKVDLARLREELAAQFGQVHALKTTRGALPLQKSMRCCAAWPSPSSSSSSFLIGAGSAASASRAASTHT